MASDDEFVLFICALITQNLIERTRSQSTTTPADWKFHRSALRLIELKKMGVRAAKTFELEQWYFARLLAEVKAGSKSHDE